MKLFFELGPTPASPSEARQLFPTNVYGPYADDAEMHRAMLRVRGTNLDQQYLVVLGEIVNAPVSTLDRPLAERREPGDFHNFVGNPNWYDCRDCHMPAGRGSIQDHSCGEDGPITWFPTCQFCDKTPAQMGDQPVRIRHAPAAR